MIQQMNQRIARRLLTAETLGLVIVIFALQVFAYGVTSSLSNSESTNFFYVCLIAAWIGWGLAKSKLKALPASVGIVALGVTGIWILGARLVDPLRDLIQSTVSLIPQIIPAIRFKTVLDAAPMIAAWGVIGTTSSQLLIRFQTWLGGFIHNVSVEDILVRNMVWLLMHWLIAAWAGWFTARRKAIAALILPLLILAFVTSYSNYRIETIWLMIFFMLLLMGLWNYKSHIDQWETHKVDYSDSIRFDTTQAVLFLTVAICSLAFATPSVSWRQVRDYLREHDKSSTKNQTANILGIQESRVPSQSIPAPKPELPRDYLLSGGYAHSQRIVMTIRTGELPPSFDSTFAENAPRYYWRSVVYDEYAGSGWVTGFTSPQNLSANTPLIPGLLTGYKLVHLNVHLEEPEGKLFWSGILFSADVPLTVNWRLRPQSDLFADQSALLQTDMFAAISAANTYKAQSYVPLVTLTSLRTTPNIYPQAIVDRYLGLPNSVPKRVIDLAREITKGKTNSYEKAKAIETYLRANYPYDLNVPAPPPGRDVADYFLFDLRKGYCDYYATTMVVLARAVGIPARFVSGYSPGTYDASSAEYIVREANAHSWAEVYFTGIGWVEFEPTSSIPEIARTDQGDTAPLPKQTDTTAANLLNRFRLEKAAFALVPIFAIFIFALLYLTLIERWWYLRLAPVLAIENIYKKFYLAGRPFAGPATRAETSREFADKVIDQFTQLDQRSRYKKMFANLMNNTARLTDIYNSALFVDVQMQTTDAHTAWRTWTQLRWRLFFARILLYRVNHLQNAKHLSIKK